MKESSLYSDMESRFRRIELLAKEDGVDLELLVERGDTLGLSVSKGQLEKFDSSQTHVGGIRVILDGVEGYSWTESLESSDLEAAYRDALESARFAKRGVNAMPKVEMWGGAGKGVGEDTSLFNDTMGEVSLDSKIERAKLLESEALRRDNRIANVPYNRYSESVGETMIFNSKGVRARQRRSGVMCYAYCLAKSGSGAMTESRMAGESFFTRNALQVPIDAVTTSAVEKAVAKLGAGSIETGHYPIVIDCEVAAELFGLIADYFSAKSLSEKTTIYAKETEPKANLEQIIGSDALSIVDDPVLPDGIGNRPFDAEGVPTKRTVLVENGVLKNFMTNSVYAKRLDLPHTANASRGPRSQLDVGPSNLVVKCGSDSLQQLLSSYPKMIYITDFTGYHAGFQHGSGAFSFQSEGELWENGKRVSAICNFVVAGSIDQMLKGLEKVSSRHSPKNSSVVAPDLLIRSLSVAGG